MDKDKRVPPKLTKRVHSDPASLTSLPINHWVRPCFDPGLVFVCVPCKFNFRVVVKFQYEKPIKNWSEIKWCSQPTTNRLYHTDLYVVMYRLYMYRLLFSVSMFSTFPNVSPILQYSPIDTDTHQ